MRRAAPCQCVAYPFPHRGGGGSCADPGKDPGGCGDCEHAMIVPDPFSTGDRWYREVECGHPDYECPWGHDN